MLTKLLDTDNMSVVGEYQKRSKFNGENENIGFTEYIFLVFTIHINGKLKTFSHYIELDKQEFGEELGLKNYEGWYILYNTLSALGYPISDFDGGLGGNIINEWINKCIELSKEPEVFQM